MGDISNKTLAILIVAILVTSLLSTWLILSQKQVDDSWISTTDKGQGILTFYVGTPDGGEQEQVGQVSFVVLPQEGTPVGN